MEEEAEQLLQQGHQIISAFLGQWIEKVDDFIQGDRQQKDLLDHAISHGLDRGRKTRKRLAAKFGVARSNKSKAKGRLNESLSRFCRNYGISPPIGLYFLSSELRRCVVHFACCDGGLKTRSSSYIHPDRLKDVLNKASHSLYAEVRQCMHPRSFVTSDVQLYYLREIACVLRIGASESPKWFRKQGPIAVDFDVELVYPREKFLSELKRQVLGESFLILEGLPGSGKTTLVRHLGYELSCNNKVPVYYFDFDLKRDFDENRLIMEIDSLEGVFILENIHENTRKCQRVYNQVRKDPRRHVLLTARPSYRQEQNSKDDDLRSAKIVRLRSSDDADAIICHYATRHPEFPWPEEVQSAIRNNAGANLWLLAYGLEGYVHSRDGGNPKSWIEKGVKEDLRNLEQLDSSFPEVLIALSPLYQNEVLTAETYLTERLGFRVDELKELVALGEKLSQSQLKVG